MPKTVDHDQRRDEIVRATWRIIAKHGMARATMRQIASEAGYANGALKPYFPTKADLLGATYRHVFDRTNRRAAEVNASLRGFDALESFCREVMPLDAERLDEARVVIEFWAEATTDEEAFELHREAVAEWREWMLGWLEEHDAGRGWDVEVDGLLTFLQGTQVTAVFAPAQNTPERLEAQLQGQLAPLR
ncbi:TetR/AcrR family transcriptional regulator [Gulosibacter sp. 10]|uniref:TetR/AcrR family transcriptional regulator n=1 Tax=Gulosibacter sp. 10 TaxID=1255570 RepID=UPI00097F47A0|nr:TetR/AcrR family transcriptional regulator [Gulosibacter sp. 10]SJM48120.1 Transcriptional regulator, TetR family [Gulosibacter sp. 10]